jgi:hypothetical protein
MKTTFARAFFLLFSFALLTFAATSCVSVSKAIAPALPALTAPLDGFMIDIEDPAQRSQAAYKIGKEEIEFIYLVHVKDLKFKVLEDLSLTTQESGATSLSPSAQSLKPGGVIKYPLYNSKGERTIKPKDLFISQF